MLRQGHLIHMYVKNIDKMCRNNMEKANSGTLRTWSNLLTLHRECAEIIIWCMEKANGGVK